MRCPENRFDRLLLSPEEAMNRPVRPEKQFLHCAALPMSAQDVDETFAPNLGLEPRQFQINVRPVLRQQTGTFVQDYARVTENKVHVRKGVCSVVNILGPRVFE